MGAFQINFLITQLIMISFVDAPNVELVLGKSISADSIYEGGDVYFDCRVKSSPPPDRVYWYHNVSWIFTRQTELSSFFLFQGALLAHSPERGIIFTNFSLVLQKISQSQAGAYMCESSNRVGKGRSEDILLDVKCEYYNNKFVLNLMTCTAIIMSSVL